MGIVERYLAVEDRPAGPAPLDQVFIATGFVMVMTLLLAWVLMGHRSGRITLLDRIIVRLDKAPGMQSVAGWVTLPLLTSLVSLLAALFGMYWDISLHIGVGRDEGPLANPAHYPILLGLFGLSASGALACALPKGDQAGPASIRLGPDWRAPIGGVLILCAGAYALLGFPLDDVWHRLFGQDVTLWGPTHLMLIGGAGLSLVGLVLLHKEGRLGSVPDPGLRRGPRRIQTFLQLSSVFGGLLIGLSVFQAEWDFGVPQFRMVHQPLMIAAAAGLSLVAARLLAGPGGALGAAVFYIAVRGGVSVIVGPMVIGELWSAIPLYLAEALCVELAAVWLARKPMALGVTSGVLIGTVGFACEYWWTGQVFPLPWTSDMVVEGMIMAIIGGVSAGVLGAMLTLGLRGELPAPGVSRIIFVVAVLAIAGCVANGLRTSQPDDLTAKIIPSATSTGESKLINARFEFNRPPVPVGDTASWIQVTAWQGGDQGLYVEPLRKIDDTTYESTEPFPVGGTWKTLLRLHDGTELTAIPIFMPEDTALDEPVVAADVATRTFGPEKTILQRELNDDIPMWLWSVAGLIVLLCSAILVGLLGWGVARFNRLGARPADAP